MGAYNPWSAQLREIEKIDYLLDNLARAVERGEVHRNSYDLMAPRFLERRAELVAIVSGANRAAAAGTPATPPVPVERVGPVPDMGSLAAGVAAGGTTAEIVGGTQAFDEYFIEPATGRQRSPDRTPVQWTTVLTFLGAFLVIVAAAIFAIGLWDVIGTIGKLVFLGGLTVAFYGAGWYVHHLGLRAGGTALATVGSVMLLLDGWIVIEGYELAGPLPWAIVLLVCSVVYWLVELVMAERFFGVIGAAAQVAWWWLLGEGLGLSVPARLAGIAIVALVWQVAAERGADSDTVGSLADVLAWAAPVAGAVVVLGLVRDVLLTQAAAVGDVLVVGIACAALGVMISRSVLSDEPVSYWLAAATQLPLFLFVLAAWGASGATWALLAIVAAMAIAYDLIALSKTGLSFAIVGMGAELLLLLVACDLLGATERVTVGAVSVLAVAWAVGARVSESSRARDGLPLAGEVGQAARVGSFVLLTVSSAACVLVGDGVPLAGVSVPAADALLALALLVAWYSSAAIARDRWMQLAGSVWSFFTLAAVVSWALPDERPEIYALALLALSAVWLFSTRVLTPVYGSIWREVTLWSARFAVLVCATAGLAVSLLAGWDGSAWPSLLLLAASAVYAVDAALNRCRVTAAAAGALAVCGFAFLGGALAERGGTFFREELWAITAALGGVLVTGAAAASRGRSMALTRPAAVAAACAATPWVAFYARESVPAAGGFALLAIAWALAAAASWQWLNLPAGLAMLASVTCVVAWNDGSPWVTVAVLNATALVMGAFAYTRIGGPEGRLEQTGIALAISGMAGHLVLIALGFFAEVFSVESWISIGLPGVAVTFAVLGAHVVAQGARWHFEPAYYAGGFAWVLGAWTALADTDATQGELYTTPLAVYLLACGSLRKRLDSARPYPVALDAAAVIVGLGYPLMLALNATTSEALIHSLWVLGLSITAIALGILVKSRWLFFGGVSALALVAGYRSFAVLAEFWWVLLGALGVAMLVVALTWERQRMIVADTRSWLRRSFEGWR